MKGIFISTGLRSTTPIVRKGPDKYGEQYGRISRKASKEINIRLTLGEKVNLECQPIINSKIK